MKEWDKISGKLDLGNDYFFSADGRTIKRECLDEWLLEMSQKPKSWNIVYYADLIPLYKIFKEPLKKQIEKCFKNQKQILLTGLIEIEDSGFEYYRIEFDSPLKSDKYQIYGTMIEKCSDIVVKFKYSDIYGFSVIVERYAYIYINNLYINIYLFVYIYSILQIQ